MGAAAGLMGAAAGLVNGAARLDSPAGKLLSGRQGQRRPQGGSNALFKGLLPTRLMPEACMSRDNKAGQKNSFEATGSHP